MKPIKQFALSKMDKILLVMHEISEKKERTIKFEDLVVGLYKKYPKDFQLKGYIKYPDSEAVNNALYHNLKKQGVITYGNKTFALTFKGQDYAKRIAKLISGKRIYSTAKLDRYIDKEIRRIVGSDGFKHFIENKKEKILDTDFYNYIGVTVRTGKNDFISRFELIKDVVETIKNNKLPNLVPLLNFHKFMIHKFNKEIKFKLK